MGRGKEPASQAGKEPGKERRGSSGDIGEQVERGWRVWAWGALGWSTEPPGPGVRGCRLGSWPTGFRSVLPL